MPRTARLCDWMMASVLAAAGAALASPAGAQTGAQPPSTRAVPVLETRCRPRLTCWFDHWGYRRCFRRWVCSDDPRPDLRLRPPGPRRYSLEEDYAPNSGIRRDREPSFRRYRGNEAPLAPEIVRPFRRGEPTPPDRRRVTVRPRLKTVPDRERGVDPDDQAEKPSEAELEPDRPTEPRTATRREEPASPEAKLDPAPDVEVIPRPQPAPPEKESARLKEPRPAPPRPGTEAPAPVKLTPLPAPRRPEKKPDADKTDKRKTDRRGTDDVPDDIDKLPRGRKIPMDEIEPPKKPKKKLPERMPI